MAAISNQSGQHWRDKAIQQSEWITDIWLVWNSYAGRLAEIVLFACMVVNIVEMLPGVSLSSVFTSTVLGVQVVSLDIGGLSLSSMAHHARENGAEKAADLATLTSRFLIGLMICTLVTVSIGLLYKDLLQYTQQIEKIMILVRIVFSVIYSSVIHSLRSSTLNVSPAKQPTIQIEEETETLEETIPETVVEELPVQLNEIEAQKESVRVSPKRETKPKQTAKQKALQIIAKHPDIDPVTLSKKLSVSEQYARKIISEQKGN